MRGSRRANCAPGSLFLMDGEVDYLPAIEPPLASLELLWTFKEEYQDAAGETQSVRLYARFDPATRAYYVLDTGRPPVRPDYLVTSSFWYERYSDCPTAPEVFRRLYEEEIPLYLGEPIRVFKAARGSYGFNNPEIRIYRLTSSASTSTADGNR